MLDRKPNILKKPTTKIRKGKKVCSFPRKAVCKGVTLATQLTRSAFTHLEATSHISKVPGLLIQCRPAGALGFNRSSPKAANQ